MPHLKRALVISRLLDARAVERATFAAVLDGLPSPSCSSAPTCGSSTPIAPGRRCCGRPTRSVCATVASPRRTASRRRCRWRSPRRSTASAAAASASPARRGDGEELVLHVLPLGEASPLPGAAAAIFVAPAVTPRPAPLAAIAALFELTPAEARVLELVGAGRTSAEIALALGVAVSTVRSHVLRLFEKTGTHRQADLVGLLAAFTLPLAYVALHRTVEARRRIVASSSGRRSGRGTPMRRPTLAFLAALAAAGCTAQSHQTRTTSADPAPAAEAGGQGAPRGGSSPVPVLIGVAIGVGLILFLLSDEGGRSFRRTVNL